MVTDEQELWGDWAARHGVDRQTFKKVLALIRGDPDYWADQGFRTLEAAARS